MLATAVVSLAGALSISSSQSTAMDVDAHALALARQLVEEVAARPFDPPAAGDVPGWSGGNRVKSTYDNVADFDGYGDTIAPSVVATLATTDRMTRAARTGYRRVVAFEYRATPAGSAALAGNLGLVTVTVQPDEDGAQPITLHRLVARYTVNRD